MIPICNFYKISRASRASLISINRHLTFEEKTHKLWERIKGYLRMRFSLVFLFLYYFLMRMGYIQIRCS